MPETVNSLIERIIILQEELERIILDIDREYLIFFTSNQDASKHRLANLCLLEHIESCRRALQAKNIDLSACPPPPGFPPIERIPALTEFVPMRMRSQVLEKIYIPGSGVVVIDALNSKIHFLCSSIAKANKNLRILKLLLFSFQREATLFKHVNANVSLRAYIASVLHSWLPVFGIAIDSISPPVPPCEAFPGQPALPPPRTAGEGSALLPMRAVSAPVPVLSSSPVGASSVSLFPHSRRAASGFPSAAARAMPLSGATRVYPAAAGAGAGR